MAAECESELLVCGAGPSGLIAAIAFARAGVDVVLAGPPPGPIAGRTVALFDGSVRFLASLGVWPAILPDAAPLATMRIVDDTDSLFRTPPVEFRAAEIGLEQFGFNVETDTLTARLAAAAAATPGIRRLPELLDDFRFEGAAASAARPDGSRASARLFIAADGRASPCRRAAGIGVTTTPYGQTALTVALSHEAPHRDVSTEFHTRGGPFTLVPMTNGVDGRRRSGLVWLMRDAEADAVFALDDPALARLIEKRAHSLLGAMRIEGRRGRFPMATLKAARLAGRRVALIGEAGHVFPPIGAQGLNLGLRDVAHLVEAVLEARAEAGDIGGEAAMAGYERLRRGDVESRTAGVDLLNRALLTDLLPMDFARGFGLSALAAIGPLRRAVMRRGVMPQLGAPRVMRAERRAIG
jgi:2-octaprenyl-6-methoxyphenol hydroxylase